MTKEFFYSCSGLKLVQYNVSQHVIARHDLLFLLQNEKQQYRMGRWLVRVSRYVVYIVYVV